MNIRNVIRNVINLDRGDEKESARKTKVVYEL